MRIAVPRTWLLLPLVLVLLLGSSAARAEDPDLSRRKEDLVLKLKVRRAIDRGAAWLAKQQQSDGSFELEGNAQTGPSPLSRHTFGESALATLTLAHCGYDVERKEIKKAVAYLKKHWRSYMKGDHWPQASSYSLAIVVLALHELYGQAPDGTDDDDRARYGSSVKRDRNPCDYPSWVRALMKRVLDWMMENRAEEGLFRYPGGLDGGGRIARGPPGGPPGGPAGGPPGGPGGRSAPGADFYGDEDMSNTQYVLLALWIGTRCGYEIKQDALEHMARRLLAWQASNGRPQQRVLDPTPEEERGTSRYGDMTRPKGVRDRARGFGYTPGDPPTGSMTTAGLSSLAIVKAMLVEQHTLDPKLGRELDQGIWDAIAWLAQHFTVEGNPTGGPGAFGRPEPMWHYYYLYGLERAGVIVGKRYLGDHDWYREGAIMLVDDQKSDGRWEPENGLARRGGRRPPGGATYRMSMLDTCFALLFLKRAAFEPKQPLLPGPVTTPSESD